MNIQPESRVDEYWIELDEANGCFHFVPKPEMDEHELTADCRCRPRKIPAPHIVIEAMELDPEVYKVCFSHAFMSSRSGL